MLGPAVPGAGDAGVAAERDGDARLVELAEALAHLLVGAPHEGDVLRVAGGVARAVLLHEARRNGLTEERKEVGRSLGQAGTTGAADVCRHEDIAPLHLCDEPVVHHLVAHQVHQAVDAGVDQAVRVLQVVDVRQRQHPVLVRFLDDRAINLRGELLHAPEAVVHPDLHRVGLHCRQLPHALAPFLGGGDREGRVGDGRNAGPAIRSRHPAAGRKQARRASRLLGSHLERQRAHVGARAQHGRQAVEGIALQVLDDVVVAVDLGTEGHAVEEADVHVSADHRGHHRLAGEVHTRATLRRGQLALPPHLSDFPSCTVNAARSTGALPSPAISVAPS